jgi:hypothetical protein
VFYVEYISEHRSNFPGISTHNSKLHVSDTLKVQYNGQTSAVKTGGFGHIFSNNIAQMLCTTTGSHAFTAFITLTQTKRITSETGSNPILNYI